jgi:hypothetical protein
VSAVLTRGGVSRFGRSPVGAIRASSYYFERAWYVELESLVASQRPHVEPQPKSADSVAELAARLTAMDQLVAQAQLAARMQREASFVAFGSAQESDAERLADRDLNEARTRQEGDDYEGTTPDEQLCIRLAEQRGQRSGREVRRQLHLQNGLRQIRAMERWACDQRRRSLEAVRSLNHDSRPHRFHQRRTDCGRPRGRRSGARRTGTGTGTRAGPSHLAEGDDGPEPSAHRLAHKPLSRAGAVR